MNTDDVWPRVPEYRYRLCAAKDNGSPVVLAAAPDMGGIGVAILQLHEDAKQVGERFDDHGRIGVLDVLPERRGPDGEWIVNPYLRSTA